MADTEPCSRPADPASAGAFPRQRLYLTKNGHSALVNPTLWNRIDFAYLGVIDINGCPTAWAWHENGRSIDRDDRAFDLVGFPGEVGNA